MSISSDFLLKRVTRGPINSRPRNLNTNFRLLVHEIAVYSHAIRPIDVSTIIPVVSWRTQIYDCCGVNLNYTNRGYFNLLKMFITLKKSCRLICTVTHSIRYFLIITYLLQYFHRLLLMYIQLYSSFNDNIDLVQTNKRRASSNRLLILGMIKRTISYKSRSILLQSLVRPHLEYCTVAWSPYYQKDKKILEKKFKDASLVWYLDWASFLMKIGYNLYICGLLKIDDWEPIWSKYTGCTTVYLQWILRPFLNVI